jgi:hypothetical protein
MPVARRKEGEAATLEQGDEPRAVDPQGGVKFRYERRNSVQPAAFLA